MTKDEALKLALEALEAHADIGINSDKAITAIKEALAQQEQEPPVAFEYDEDNDPIGEVVGFIEGSNYIMVKVYDGKQVSLNDDLYDTPPQRTWQGLTDEEIDAVTDSQWAKGVNKPIYAAHRAYARAIEAKLKEKNGA